MIFTNKMVYQTSSTGSEVVAYFINTCTCISHIISDLVGYIDAALGLKLQKDRSGKSS